MPALCLKSLTPRCGVVPLPAGPLLSVPGWALAEATNSFRELGARLGRVIRKSWLLASNATGCRSLCGSKGMRVNSTGFTDSVVETVTRKVWPSPPLCTTSAPATFPPPPPPLSMTSAGPARVVDEEGLAERLAQWLLEQSRHDVGQPSRGEGHDQAHRLRRPRRGLGGNARDA